MIIGIVSGKGGVGKTTIASNLSYYLSLFGKRVTLIDCNITTSHLNFNFGLFTPYNNLNDVLRGDKELTEVIYKYGNLSIIPASLRLEDLSYVNLLELKNLVKKIDSDYVILDSAPGFGKEAISVLNSVDTVIFVTLPFLNSVVDIIRAKKILEELHIFPLGIIVNMVKGKNYELKKGEIETITKIKVLGEIPYDENVEMSLSLGKPFIELYPNSPASLSLKRICNYIFGTPVEEKRISFLEKFYEKFKSISNKFKVI
ncbi:MAG: P-loop NTPase [Candidatus Aenigmatarchaeota archaeon]